MRFSDIAVASLVAPLVTAHGGTPGAPKIFGLGPNPLAKLKGRNVFHGHVARHGSQHEHQLNARQGGVNGQCGSAASGASCDAGYCCSPSGYCGQGSDYCAAPDCQFQYGPACDANITPGGTNTSSIARTQLGSITYGGDGIYDCKVPGTVAITYDDGPYIYTAGVLDQFASYGAKATFFVTGNNLAKGPIDDSSTAWPGVIQRMISEGHQVASHTWSHQDLSAITSQQRKDQMVRNEMAIRNIIGKFPTYMRPPYSSCTAASGCEDDLAQLGYVVSYFDVDTDDYDNTTPEKIQNAKDNFSKPITPSNNSTDDFLVIAHDIHQQTAQNLTGYMLGLLQQKGYKAVTMGECMGDPPANWYRDSAGSLGTYSSSVSSASATATATATVASVASVASPTAVSPDGSCGGTTGYTCIGFSGGSCCSKNGWCGSSSDYCATGCQSAFGTCGTSSSTGSAASSSSSVSASSSTVSGISSTGSQSSSAVSSTSTQAPSSSTVSQSSSTSTRAPSSTVSQSSSVSTQAPSSSTVSQSSSTTSNTPTQASSSSTKSSTLSSVVSSSSVASSKSATSSVPSSSAVQSLITTAARSTTTTASSTSTSSASSTSTLTVSQDGTCGGSKKQTCLGSGKGECCGLLGQCSYILGCGLGCQQQYGKCWF